MNIGFPILWVQGNYKTAEESFIKINKTGQRLSEWETKLVEHRASCAARLIMSIAQQEGSVHCWPEKVLSEESDKTRVKQIVNSVATIRQRIFTPTYHLPIDEARQPLLGISPGRPDLVAPYVAELLTVAVGSQRGLPSDTEELLKRTKAEEPSDIVKEGWDLVNDLTETLDHIYGPSPRSLMVMPLVYFYNEDGACIRALLYGFLHWIKDGSDKDVSNRKILFSANRARFEEVLVTYKRELVNRISRRIGSGPEVTIPMGRYYNGLLELLIGRPEAITDQSFKTAHHQLLERLDSPKEIDVSLSQRVAEGEQPRAFRGRTKQRIKIAELINTFSRCGICNGRLHPGLSSQMDHIQMHSEGGHTTVDNGRSVHPFCNNQRKQIENLQGGKLSVKQPLYIPDKDTAERMSQLVFLSALFDREAEPLWWSVEGQEAPQEAIDADL